MNLFNNITCILLITCSLLPGLNAKISPKVGKTHGKQGVLYHLDIEQLHKASRDLAEFTLQNLSEKVVVETKKLFSNFGKLIKAHHLSVYDLEYLLKAVPTARCELVPKYNPNRKERLQKISLFRKILLAAKDNHFPADFEKNIESHVINIESFMTAIGYTSLIRTAQSGSKKIEKLGPGWINIKETPSKNLTNFILLMHYSGFKVPAIESTNAFAFRCRSKDDVTKKILFNNIPFLNLPTKRNDILDSKKENTSYPLGEYIVIPQYKQSSLPDSSMEKLGLGIRIYHINSYVTEGLLSGVSMRAHASGSASLTLAAMQFINSLGVKPDTIDEEELAIQAGMIVALYETGDYHSPAETAAGICHYHQTAKNERIYVTNEKPIDEQYLDEIHPRYFLAMAIGYLGYIVADEKLDEFNELSQKVLELTSDVE